jgi:hypothetical protein
MHGRNQLRRLLPVLALSACVATLAVPAQARQGGRPAPPVGPAAVWSTEARAFLSRLWQSGSHGLHSLFGAEGASLDPNGGAPTGSGAGVGAGAAVTPGHPGA